MSNLHTIFNLVALPKALGRPPRGAKIINAWTHEAYVDCARFFNSRVVKPSTRSGIRRVYLSEEVNGTKVLYLVEEPKAPDLTV